MSKSKKQIKKEIVPESEVKERLPSQAYASEQNEVVEEIEEVQEKPKKKEVTEAMREHLATIRVKALKVKAERKALREKAKQLENVELELKADKYDAVIEEKQKLKEEKEVVEVVEETKPKKIKKVIIPK